MSNLIIGINLIFLQCFLYSKIYYFYADNIIVILYIRSKEV